jgi:hypothetical protein
MAALSQIFNKTRLATHFLPASRLTPFFEALIFSEPN